MTLWVETRRRVALTGTLLAVLAASGACSQSAAAPVVQSYQVVRSFPHDPDAFTQGMIFQDGFLYEGTGLNGRSSIRKVELATGKVLRKRDLAPEFFGEGLTAWRGRLVQLTWQSQTGFVYDRASFRPLSHFSYPGEGWGLTHDGRRLILSDGTPQLRFLDPVTFAEQARVTVTDEGRPLPFLNELEHVRGEVYANIWPTNRIARIDPKTGKVKGWIDLTGLLNPADQGGRAVDVLNGIAYDARGDRLFVTGKLWPRLFEIKLVPVR